MYFGLQSAALSVSPELAVVLLVVGAITINCEFMRPGTYALGAAGLALCLIALAVLATKPVPVTSALLASAALLAFIAQWQRRWRMIPGAVGAMLWAGAIRSYGISAMTSLLLALPQGALLTFSLVTAHQSRTVKRNVIKIVVDAPPNSPDNRKNAVRSADDGKHEHE